MANVTDPLVRAIQGSDPQNMMEYITRQKIYDSRYWKEDCFGLAAVDVLEKAARIKTIGGLPCKFVCLVLKLLQLNPEPEDIIESFIQQEEFKYVRALGALYVRLVGRPPDIYDALEPLYRDYRKLRCRMHHSDWSIVHMDEFIHQLFAETTCVGITLPRLPARATLQEAGYLDEGARPTALKDVLDDVGGPLAFLTIKVEQNSPAAIALWGKRNLKKNEGKTNPAVEQETKEEAVHGERKERQHQRRRHEKSDHRRNDMSKNKHRKKRQREEAEEGEVPFKDESEKDDEEEHGKKRGKKRNYAGLFKTDKSGKKNRHQDDKLDSSTRQSSPPPDEHSDEYWNEQRARLGLSKLR